MDSDKESAHSVLEYSIRRWRSERRFSNISLILAFPAILYTAFFLSPLPWTLLSRPVQEAVVSMFEGVVDWLCLLGLLVGIVGLFFERPRWRVTWMIVINLLALVFRPSIGFA